MTDYKCSDCGHTTDDSLDSEFECPYCGIKMEEQGEKGMTRLCAYCKKPMFNSWAGEWVNRKFIEIHSKCKEKWKNKKRGKKSRASGQRFEKKVRKDLEGKGWIVDKWSNNVSFDSDADKFYKVKKGTTGLLVPVKNKFRGKGIPMMLGAGFPDFIAFKFVKKEKEIISSKGVAIRWYIKETENVSRTKLLYEIIGVEAKSNGSLKKEEKEKCVWLLENKIFSKILVAKKDPNKRGNILYKEFKNA